MEDFIKSYFKDQVRKMFSQDLVHLHFSAVAFMKSLCAWDAVLLTFNMKVCTFRKSKVMCLRLQCLLLNNTCFEKRLEE